MVMEASVEIVPSSQNNPPAQVLNLKIEVEPTNTPQNVMLDASHSSPLEGR